MIYSKTYEQHSIVRFTVLNKDFTIYSIVSRIDIKRKLHDKIEIELLLFIIQCY